MFEGILSNSKLRKIRADKGGGMRIIDHAHSRGHDGKLWTHCFEFSNLSATAVASVAIKAAAGKRIHVEAFVSADNAGSARAYKNPVYTGGASLAGINSDFDSSDASPGVAVSNPTGIPSGTLFSGVSFASGQGNAGGGQGGTRYECQLSANSSAAISFTAKNNSTNGFIVLVLYEEEL